VPPARDTKSASARSARIARVSFVGHRLVQCKPDRDLFYSHRRAGPRGHAAGPEPVNRAVPRQERGRGDARLLPSPKWCSGTPRQQVGRAELSTAWRIHRYHCRFIRPLVAIPQGADARLKPRSRRAMIAPRRLRSCARWVTLTGVLHAEEPKGSMTKLSRLSANYPCRSNRHRADAGIAGPWCSFTANSIAQ
jgi:hypothetical protein